MSYNLTLHDPYTGEVLLAEANHFMPDTDPQPDGCPLMMLNITFRYMVFYKQPHVMGKKGLHTIRWLTGAQSLPILKRAMKALHNDATNNYLDATEGNAKRALAGLVALALQRPDGKWDIKYVDGK